MSSTQLDKYAAAALTGLLASREWQSKAELAGEAFRIANAMMDERRRQLELPDSAILEQPILSEPLAILELPLRITKKLRGAGIERVRDLTLTTEKSIRDTGLGDESLNEIRESLHRHALKLAE